MYNFDKVIDRSKSNSVKWNNCDGIIPLWIADMDFPCANEITEQIINRAKHPIYGYTNVPEAVYEAIIKWQYDHNGIKLNKNNLVFNVGVMQGIYLAIKLLTTKKDKIIVQTPIYPPFINTPKELQRECVFNPLINNDGYYTMDLVGLEDKLKNDPNIKVMLLCNPHNPVGRVWTKKELNDLLTILDRYQIFLICDEIHGDLMMKNHKLTSIYNVDEKYNNRIIVMSSPTKTFNIAGIKIAYTMIKDIKLQERFAHEAKNCGISAINIFGYEAIIAAYNHGQVWLDEALEYIEGNFDYLKEYLQKYLPKCHYLKPEGTYLAWVDFGEYGVKEDFCSILTKEARVFLNAGVNYSEDTKTYARINVACPRSTLTKGLDRIREYFTK